MGNHKTHRDRGGYSRLNREELIDRLMKLEADHKVWRAETDARVKRLQAYVAEMEEEKGAGTSTNTIKNNTFTGIHWDRQATEAVYVVAESLRNLTHLFKSQNVTIESMIRIDEPNKQTPVEELLKLDKDE